MTGIVCDAGISKYGLGGKKVKIRVFDLSKRRELLFKEFEQAMSCNFAELVAIYEAAKVAHFRQRIFSDSQTALNWILNSKKIKEQDTRILVEKIRKIIFNKELSVSFWDKKSLGKNPADCKSLKPSKRRIKMS